MHTHIKLSFRRGEELLRKRCGLDSPKPSVNLEDPALISKLFHLFQGSPEPQAASTTQPAAAAATAVADSHVLPAGVLLQSRLMSLFTKSTAAANHFPGTIQVHSLCLCTSVECCFQAVIGCSLPYTMACNATETPPMQG